jgi:hypothetical protein
MRCDRSGGSVADTPAMPKHCSGGGRFPRFDVGVLGEQLAHIAQASAAPAGRARAEDEIAFVAHASENVGPEDLVTDGAAMADEHGLRTG